MKYGGCMKRYLLYLWFILFIASCTPKEKELTADDKAKEEQAIIGVMKTYTKANEEKNFSALVETLAQEVTFYGTDSAEVLKTFPEYKKAMLKQWQLFDKQKYGEMTDISIIMDKAATLATITFGIPFDVTIGDKTAHLFLRMSRTLKKENDKWVIAGGIVGGTSTAQVKALEDLLRSKTTTDSK